MIVTEMRGWSGVPDTVSAPALGFGVPRSYILCYTDKWAKSSPAHFILYFKIENKFLKILSTL